MHNEDEIDITNSVLLLEGSEEEQDKISKLIDKRVDYLTEDKVDRKRVYAVRRDFYVGNHGKYTNIVGLQKKEKKGHANAVLNYAGKSAQKIAQAMSNNPPNMTFSVDPLYKPFDADYQTEETRTQSVEDFTQIVFDRNRFWKRGYRRGSFNQSIVGDFALKVYPCNIGTKEQPEWDIRVVAQEKIENLLVGWRGDDAKEFDFVICEEEKSIQSIEEEWGIKVPMSLAEKSTSPEDKRSNSGHNENQWGQKNVGLGGRAVLPTGENSIPTVMVREYDDENVYAIKIGTKLVQYAKKDDETYPKMKFWIMGENVPNPGSHWSIADIDYLIDPNIELNEGSNEERDLIRVGTGQKFVAYNMPDFDPESIKTGSGGVIFVESQDGSSKFEPLQTNVNNYPADSYLSRMKKHIHDLGIPEVTYGSAGADSGRSKAIDYQSMVDLVVFKRDAWELALDEVSEKIQKLGYFYFKEDFFTDAKSGELKVRHPDFDWSDVVPITQSDKIVNIVNKVQMGLPFRLAFKELGYKDVDAVIDEMKKEAQDKDLMIFRSKMFNLAPGTVKAETEAASQSGGMGGNPNAQAAGPTLTTSQNSGRDTSLPVSQQGGTTSFSTGQGLIDRARQNMQAQGK